MNLQKVANGFSEQFIKSNPKKKDTSSFADKLEIVNSNKFQERPVDKNIVQEKPKTESQKKAKESPKVEEVKKEEVKSEEVQSKEVKPEETKVVEEISVQTTSEDQNDAQAVDKLPIDSVLSDEDEEKSELESTNEEINSEVSISEEYNKIGLNDFEKVGVDTKGIGESNPLEEGSDVPPIEKIEIKGIKTEAKVESDFKKLEADKPQSEISLATENSDEEELATKGLDIRKTEIKPEVKSEVKSEESLKKDGEQVDDAVENSKFVANTTFLNTDKVEVEEVKEEIQEVQRPVFEDLRTKAKPKGERGFNMGSENAEINDVVPQHFGRNVQKVNFQTFEEVINEKFDSTETVKTMLEDISYQVNQSKRQMTIQLKPESLGEMTVDLRLDKGSIVAKIVVENDRAKEMIEQNLFQLKETLRNSKVEIKTVEVFVGQENDFRNHQGQMRERQPQQTFIRNLKPNQGYEEMVEEELATTISGRGEGLDISV